MDRRSGRSARRPGRALVRAARHLPTGAARLGSTSAELRARERGTGDLSPEAAIGAEGADALSDSYRESTRRIARLHRTRHAPDAGRWPLGTPSIQDRCAEFLCKGSMGRRTYADDNGKLI